MTSAQFMWSPQQWADYKASVIERIGGSANQNYGESEEDWYNRLWHGGYFGEVGFGAKHFLSNLDAYGLKRATQPQSFQNYNPQQQQQITQNLINAQNPVQPLNQFTMPQTPSAPSSPTMPSLPSYNRPSMFQGQYGMFGGSTASNAANPEGGVTNLPNLFEQLSPYRKFYQR